MLCLWLHHARASTETHAASRVGQHSSISSDPLIMASSTAGPLEPNNFRCTRMRHASGQRTANQSGLRPPRCSEYRLWQPLLLGAVQDRRLSPYYMCSFSLCTYVRTNFLVLYNRPEVCTRCIRAEHAVVVQNNASLIGDTLNSMHTVAEL